MIVFDGNITGEAEKRVLEKARDSDQLALFLTAIPVLPFLLFLSRIFGVWVWAYLLIFAFIPILVRIIPKSKKEKQQICPNRIVIDNEYIFVKAGKKEYRMNVSDVKEVQDCKTYYEFRFRYRIGRFCYCCICQKDLLVKGTLEELETMFKDKLTDMTDYFE